MSIAVRTAIRDLMLTVPEIGVVHLHERYAADLAKLKQLYGYDGHVRGWFIRRTAVRETGIALPRYLEVNRWQIRGVLSLNDETSTELVMDSLIEGVRDVIRDNPSLNNTVTKTGLLQPNAERGLQLEDFGPVMFGGVLCHGARLSLTTTTEKSQ
jgi:hypothetical protein